MFASIRQLQGRIEPIDDVESLLYVMAFCLDKFKLPWQHLKDGCTIQEYYKLRISHSSHFFGYFTERLVEPMRAAFKYIAYANGYMINSPRSLDYYEGESTEKFILTKKRVFDHQDIRTLFQQMVQVFEKSEEHEVNLLVPGSHLTGENPIFDPVLQIKPFEAKSSLIPPPLKKSEAVVSAVIN